MVKSVVTLSNTTVYSNKLNKKRGNCQGEVLVVPLLEGSVLLPYKVTTVTRPVSSSSLYYHVVSSSVVRLVSLRSLCII